MAQALGYVTKNEAGNFQGTLNLGGAARINIVANDNKERGKQPDFRIVDSLVQELGTLGGCFKTREVYPERLYLAHLRPSDPRPA